MRATKGYSGDECVLVSTFCKYDLRKGNLFVLSWVRAFVSRVMTPECPLKSISLGLYARPLKLQI